MKKILAYLLVALLTYAGLWTALLAATNDAQPMVQMGQALLAAVLFLAAILAAGWGNSMDRRAAK